MVKIQNTTRNRYSLNKGPAKLCIPQIEIQMSSRILVIDFDLQPLYAGHIATLPRATFSVAASLTVSAYFHKSVG